MYMISYVHLTLKYVLMHFASKIHVFGASWVCVVHACNGWNRYSALALTWMRIGMVTTSLLKILGTTLPESSSSPLFFILQLPIFRCELFTCWRIQMFQAHSPSMPSHFAVFNPALIRFSESLLVYSAFFSSGPRTSGKTLGEPEPGQSKQDLSCLFYATGHTWKTANTTWRS